MVCKIFPKTWRHAKKDESRAQNWLWGEEKIFTPGKQVSFGWVGARECDSAEDGKISSQSNDNPQRGLRGLIARAQFDTLWGEQKRWLRVRWEFPAKPALRAAGTGAPRLALRRQKRLRRWRTRGTPSPFRPGCERTLGLPVADVSTSVALFAGSFGSIQPLGDERLLGIPAPGGPNSR